MDQNKITYKRERKVSKMVNRKGTGTQTQTRVEIV